MRPRCHAYASTKVSTCWLGSILSRTRCSWEQLWPAAGASPDSTAAAVLDEPAAVVTRQHSVIGDGRMSAPTSAGHQDATIADARLGEDGLQVILDCVLRDIQLGRDLARVGPGRQGGQQLGLA